MLQSNIFTGLLSPWTSCPLSPSSKLFYYLSAGVLLHNFHRICIQSAIFLFLTAPWLPDCKRNCHLPFFSSQLPPALTLTLPDPAPPSDLWHDLYYNAREMSDTHLKEELIKWWHLEWYLQKLSNSSQKQSACTISTTGERKNVFC